MRLVLSAALAAMIFLPAPLAAESVPTSQAEIGLSFAPLVRRAAPTVVNIYAVRVVDDRASPFDADPLFRDFFGEMRRR